MVTLILFAPLLGALLCGFGWRFLGEKMSQVLTTGLVFFAAALSWTVFFTLGDETTHVVLLRWIESGSLSTDWGIRLDRLTAIMLVVVNSVSALVHLYSFGYMAHDDNWSEKEHYRARFFAYLSFFTFAMLMLVTSDNLVQMFFGWEGVGVASYLLIGFYYKKPSANAAAIKAFVVNRVGDFGFALGIFALYFLTDSIKLDDVFAAAPHLAEVEIGFLWGSFNAANLIGVLLFIGAMGKSAQLGLHTWLPDAMEGPTPVSALIHAATMVTAGVFLVCRMSPIYEFAPAATDMIVVVGATTAFFAATVGLVQNDIKRVIAYSTCSQLGYMFVAAGVGAYSVAMFHLFTHAFFKAMLFLGAGSVIHAMHHEQDMRKYGGLRKKIPFTFSAMLIGTLAITGVGIPFTHIGFAGFLSKDAVIESAFVGSSYAFWLLVIAAFMTSFYSWRLMFMTFYGSARGDHHKHDHAHESPKVMLVPLAVLALGAAFSGMIWYNSFFGDEPKLRAWFGMEAAMAHEGAGAEANPGTASHDAVATKVAHDTADQTHTGAPKGAIAMGADNHIIHEAHQVPAWVKLSPFIAMIFGLALAYLMYIKKPQLPAQLAGNQKYLYQFILNKWYFDEIYNFLIVRPALWLGRGLWKKGDGVVIDGSINRLALGILPFFTRAAARAQSGYIFTYAFAMVLGIALLITWMSLSGGAQ